MELRIGENIKRLRTARGLTQEQLADMLCISGAAVSKWKTADIYPDIGLSNWFETREQLTEQLLPRTPLSIVCRLERVCLICPTLPPTS